MQAVTELQKQGKLAGYFGGAETDVFRTYGATVRGSATVAVHGRQEDFVATVAPSREWNAVQLTGITVAADHPLELNYIVEKATTELTTAEFVREQKKVLEHFLAAATVESDDLWVNLSAYESNRMIPPVLAGTRLGRDLLACDCTLKRFAASLMHPEQEPGKTYWERVQAAVHHWYGRGGLPSDCFQKVWFKPACAVVYEKGFGAKEQPIPQEDGSEFYAFATLGVPQPNAAMLIADSHLEVLCESDMLALAHQHTRPPEGLHALCLDLFKEIVLPVIEREMNCCENFAVARQIYRAVILATAFKQAFSHLPGVASALAQGPALVERARWTGFHIIGSGADEQAMAANEPLTSTDRDNEEFHAVYMQLFEEGVFRLTRRELDPQSGGPVVRTYFSGGMEACAGVIIGADAWREWNEARSAAGHSTWADIAARGRCSAPASGRRVGGSGCDISPPRPRRARRGSAVP